MFTANSGNGNGSPRSVRYATKFRSVMQMDKYNIGVLYLAIGIAGVGATFMRGDYYLISIPVALIAAALYIMHLTAPVQS